MAKAWQNCAGWKPRDTPPNRQLIPIGRARLPITNRVNLLVNRTVSLCTDRLPVRKPVAGGRSTPLGKMGKWSGCRATAFLWWTPIQFVPAMISHLVKCFQRLARPNSQSVRVSPNPGATVVPGARYRQRPSNCTPRLAGPWTGQNRSIAPLCHLCETAPQSMKEQDRPSTSRLGHRSQPVLVLRQYLLSKPT